MKEFVLVLSAMTASHHRWPTKPFPELAPIAQPAPSVQTRYVDLRELRKAVDRYCREQKRLAEAARNEPWGIFRKPMLPA